MLVVMEVSTSVSVLFRTQEKNKDKTEEWGRREEERSKAMARRAERAV